MTHHHSFGAAVMTSAITGVVAVIPPNVLNYAEKLLSVLVLAMVAEAGRRLISVFWKEKK